MKTLINKLGYALLFVLACAASWWLLQIGFAKIQALRQLERVPNAQAAYVLPGEVTLNATAQVDAETTGSYFTQTPSLFYHYRRERKTTDSEGKTRWRTEFTHTDGVDFLLRDESGQLPVRIAGHADAVNWDLRQSFSETHGDLRHTEWRLEPGDRVFVFAKAVLDHQTVALRFDEPGFYDPILSHFSQADVQAGFGGKGVWSLWAGLASVALAVFAVAKLLGLHRILVFVFLVGSTQMLLLTHLSLTMMRADLRNGLTRYQQQKSAAESQATAAFAAHSLERNDWPSLDSATLPQSEAQRLRAYQRYLALSQQRLAQQMNAKPERWLLSAWDTPPPAPIEGLKPEDEVLIRQQLAALPATRLSGLWIWLGLSAGALAAAIMTWLALRSAKVKRLIENLPHVPTRGISCGVTETRGELVPLAEDAQLRTPHFRTPCVWYFFHKEEKRGSGKRQRWVTLEKETRSQRFLLRDSEGQIPLVADKAEIITRHKRVHKEGKLRYTETTLQAGDPIYTVAVAAIDPAQPDRLHLCGGNMNEPFIVSNFSERDVMLRKASASMLAICGAVAGLLLTMLNLFGVNGGFSALDFLAAASLMPAYMMVVMLLLHYNDLIFLRQRALRNWANIDVALKKRKELIDGFARTARAFLDHERSLQQKLSQLRAALTQTQNNQAKVAEYLRLENQFHRTLSVVIENYPDLKSQELMQRLMTVISDGETEIALLRQGYNDAATVYNTRIATVPDVMFAKLFHFGRLELIAA